MSNDQPPERKSSSDEIEIQSIFPTIQGEGPFAGQPATFIRLAGCNLQCPQCDTDYTSRRRVVPLQQIVNQVIICSAPNRLVVLTGGEPFRQQIGPLILVLVKNNFRVQIETNGSLWQDLPRSSKLTIVCSPKTGRINPKLFSRIDAYKYVLHADEVDPTDGLPIRALEHPARPRVARPPPQFYRGRVFVAPCDDGIRHIGVLTRHVNAAVASCIKFGYTLSLQQHKLLNME